MSAADRPPRWVWWIPAGVAALRMLPLLALERWPLPAGQVSLGVRYLPRDFLQYAAFVRQPSEGALLSRIRTRRSRRARASCCSSISRSVSSHA